MVRKIPVTLLLLLSLICTARLSYAAAGQQNYNIETSEDLSASENRLVVYPDGAGGFHAMYFDKDGNILKTSEKVDSGTVIRDGGNDLSGNMEQQRHGGSLFMEVGN